MAAARAEAPTQFGISLVPAIEQLDRIPELVRAADESTLELVGIQDHPYQRHFVDTWSLIPTLLAETKRVSFFTDVANLPRIWVGAFKPRMLRLVGRKADGWLPSLGVLTRDEMRAANGQIDEAAENAGRDPSSIRRILNLQGVIGDAAPSRSELPVGYLAGEPLAGPADWWVETLAGFVDDGFDTLVFWPVEFTPGQVELFAGDVVPQLRPAG